MSIVSRLVIFVIATLLSFAAFGTIESGKSESGKNDFVLDLNAVANGLIAADDYSLAHKLAEDQYRNALATLGEYDHDLYSAVHMYSMVMKLTAKRSDAKESMKRMVSELEAKFGKNTYSLTYLLIVLGSIENGAEQDAAYQRALQIQRTVFPNDIASYGALAREMGFSYTYVTKRYGHALQMLGVALPVYEAEFGQENESVLSLHMAQARAYAGFEAIELANASHKKAFAIAVALAKPELEADVWLDAGRNLSLISRPTEALNHLHAALERYEELLGADHLKVATTRVAIAEFSIFFQTPGRAAEQLLQALTFFKGDPRYLDQRRKTLELLVEAYEDIGLRDEATKYCLAISRITPWTNNQNYQPILKRAPEYPAGAAEKKQDGYVIVEYTVDKNGFVQSPKIVESTAPESFYSTSITASYLFRYAPRLENGEFVATEGVRNKFTFKLPE